MQGIHKLDKFPRVSMLLLEEPPMRRLHWAAFSSQRECVWQLTRFASRKLRFRLNRISHPDWVKLSVELNCAPNQNTKFFLSLQVLRHGSFCWVIQCRSQGCFFSLFKQWYSFKYVFTQPLRLGQLPSRLKLQNTATASHQRGKTSPLRFLDMTLNNLRARLQ